MNNRQPYLITLKNDKDVYESIEQIKSSIVFEDRKIEGVAMNFAERYGNKTRDITCDQYTNYKLHKHIDTNFSNGFTRDLAKNMLEEAKYQVLVELTEYEKLILENKDFVRGINETNKMELMGSNSQINFTQFSPVNNFALVSQNYVYQNAEIQNIGNNDKQKLFNSTLLENNNPLPYNQPNFQTDTPIDIIILDNGVWWNHSNLTRDDGTKICQYTFEQQAASLWRLSKIYDIFGLNYTKDILVPEGVATNTPQYYSYYTPTAADMTNGNFNHGTFVAGLIAGTETGWLKNKKVRIHSIPLVNIYNGFIAGVNDVLERIIELLILEFQIKKIVSGDYSPTLICRSYDKAGWFDNKDLFSNFTQNPQTKLYRMKKTIGMNISPNGIVFDDDGLLSLQLGTIYKLQRKFGAIGFYAAGNNNELQLKYSVDKANYYNRFYIQSNNYVVYPYRPYYTILDSAYYTVLGKKLTEIDLAFVKSYNSFFTFSTGNPYTFTIDYVAIKKLITDGYLTYQTSYMIMDPEPANYLVGSSGIRPTGVIDTLPALTGKPYFWLENYLPNGTSSFGDVLYNAQGSNMYSSAAYDPLLKYLNSIYYTNGEGTSFANANMIGIIGVFLQWIVSKGFIGPNKNGQDKTDTYVKNYLETYNINLNNLLFKQSTPLSDAVNTNLEQVYLDLKYKNNKSSYTDFYPFKIVGSGNYNQPIPNIPVKIIYQINLALYSDPFPNVIIDNSTIVQLITAQQQVQINRKESYSAQITAIKDLLTSYNNNNTNLLTQLSNDQIETNKAILSILASIAAKGTA